MLIDTFAFESSLVPQVATNTVSRDAPYLELMFLFAFVLSVTRLFLVKSHVFSNIKHMKTRPTSKIGRVFCKVIIIIFKDCFRNVYCSL